MAKDYNKSSYALNKFSKGIVYIGATGIYEITEKQFLAENPGMTHEDFMFWKNFSDDDYEAELRADTNEKKHTVPLGAIEETELVCDESAEDTYIFAEVEAKCPRTFENAMSILDEANLTPIQRRRYIEHNFNGLDGVQIAAKEGVRQNAVWTCLQAANKKIKKALQKRLV